MTRACIAIFLLVMCISDTFNSFYCCAASAAHNGEISCAICRKNIAPGTRYFKASDGKNYCSDNCFQSTLPACAGCGKRTAEGMMITGMTEQLFCNKCAAKPKCFCCCMPANCGTLADGRFICPECAKTAVLDEDSMRTVVNEVRAVMKDKLNIATTHNIKFILADINTLSGKAKREQDSTELGTYLYEEETERTVTTTKGFRGKILSRNESSKVTKAHSIYLLYGTARVKMIEVAAHELAYDWLQEYYPWIQNLQIQEGWAEYAASLVNTVYRRDFMNKRMAGNPSVIYGDGYRLVLGAAKSGSAALSKFLEKYNTAPKPPGS